MTVRIDRLWPNPANALDDDALLEAYAFPPHRNWLRMNFISSIDGAATSEGRSGGLGDDADHRVFDLLRRSADAILVGAGTARDEGYAGPSLFGSFLAGGVVDELCLTVAPTLMAGSAGRIARGESPTPTDMGLSGVMRANDELLLRYTRGLSTQG